MVGSSEEATVIAMQTKRMNGEAYLVLTDLIPVPNATVNIISTEEIVQSYEQLLQVLGRPISTDSMNENWKERKSSIVQMRGYGKEYLRPHFNKMTKKYTKVKKE
ncbi:hypothetical protein PoB_002499000 [Plakobranchus ocellatus]|uniref:Uncharacterized protein n=1 Tax=Plakobranchus ocellatus TaxID=259542 RepID=A0AAV3ZV48_9GAST|nr:hypothetical protein PoB_002499000 [Plakobranchus ocellatus]